MSYKRYWLALTVVIVASFAILGGVGRKMISEAPPLPDVYTADGQLLFTGSSITDGQGVWQSIGGQEIGTVWGHGAYIAPDWSADWLHRESLILLDTWAARTGGLAGRISPPTTAAPGAVGTWNIRKEIEYGRRTNRGRRHLPGEAEHDLEMATR